MHNDTWPPPPTLPATTPPVPTAAAHSRAERVCGAVSLTLAILSLVTLAVDIGYCTVLTLQGSRPPTAAVGAVVIASFVGEVVGLVVGIVGRRTVTGKAGVALSIVSVLIFGVLYLVGTMVTRR